MKACLLCPVLLVLGLASALSAQTPEPAPWRVVVQDAYPRVLAAGRDHSTVCGVEASHLFHVVDVANARVLLTVTLPAPILSAAVADDNATFAVATDRSVHIVSLETGESREVLGGVYGAMAFGEDPRTLGVLGKVPDYGVETWSFMDLSKPGAVLRVHDLDKRWRPIAEAPTVIRGEHTLLYDDGVFIAYGLGGEYMHRVQMTFRTHLELNVQTGATTSMRGQKKKVSGEVVDEHGDPDYRPPKSVRLHKIRIPGNQRRVARIADTIRLSKIERDALLFAGVGLPEAARFSVGMRTGGAERFAVVTVDGDGNIAIGETRPGRGTRAWGTRLVSARPGPTELVVFDLSTGQDLFRAPGEWQPHTKWWRQITFAGRGCLMRGDENLVYYAQRSTGPAWTLEFPQTALSGPRAYRAALSVDGTMLAAVRYPLDGSAVRVVEVGTSATTARIRVPEELRDEHLRSMSFDEDCKHLAMILGDQLLAYDVASGRLLRRQDAGAHFRYPQCLSRLSGGWLVCGEPKAVVWRDDGTWGREVRVERACAAREVDTVSGRRILIETEGRLGALVRRKTGGVIDRWPCCQERSRYDADEPLYCFVAFGGRVLVRRVGPRRVVELVDLRTAQSILAIHFLPVGEQIGWIAYTPDGFWDATPGAEKHVAVFRGTEFADEKATASRRNPQLIRARIKTLCSGQ